MLKGLIFAWLRVFVYLLSLNWISLNKDSVFSWVYGTTTFLAWAAQGFIIFKALFGVVFEGPLRILAAWVSSGKPTVFRISLDFLHLLLWLLSSNAGFRRPRIPEAHWFLAWTILRFSLQNTLGFFLHQSVCSKSHYKHEIILKTFILGVAVVAFLSKTWRIHCAVVIYSLRKNSAKYFS